MVHWPFTAHYWTTRKKHKEQNLLNLQGILNRCAQRLRFVFFDYYYFCGHCPVVVRRTILCGGEEVLGRMLEVWLWGCGNLCHRGAVCCVWPLGLQVCGAPRSYRKHQETRCTTTHAPVCTHVDAHGEREMVCGCGNFRDHITRSTKTS